MSLSKRGLVEPALSAGLLNDIVEVTSASMTAQYGAVTSEALATNAGIFGDWTYGGDVATDPGVSHTATAANVASTSAYVGLDYSYVDVATSAPSAATKGQIFYNTTDDEWQYVHPDDSDPATDDTVDVVKNLAEYFRGSIGTVQNVLSTRDYVTDDNADYQNPAAGNVTRGSKNPRVWYQTTALEWLVRPTAGANTEATQLRDYFVADRVVWIGGAGSLVEGEYQKLYGTGTTDTLAEVRTIAHANPEIFDYVADPDTLVLFYNASDSRIKRVVTLDLMKRVVWFGDGDQFEHTALYDAEFRVVRGTFGSTGAVAQAVQADKTLLREFTDPSTVVMYRNSTSGKIQRITALTVSDSFWFNETDNTWREWRGGVKSDSVTLHNKFEDFDFVYWVGTASNEFVSNEIQGTVNVAGGTDAGNTDAIVGNVLYKRPDLLRHVTSGKALILYEKSGPAVQRVLTFTDQSNVPENSVGLWCVVGETINSITLTVVMDDFTEREIVTYGTWALGLGVRHVKSMTLDPTSVTMIKLYALVG